MDLFELYKKCNLCPRRCGVNRTGSDTSAGLGFCSESNQLRVAYVGPHFGEEPPISGKNGSGAVFFAGCSLKCSYCQNYQISRDGLGADIAPDKLLVKLLDMIALQRVHNVNFVTPDHYFPHVFHLVTLLRGHASELPVIYNLSGYQSVKMLKIAAGYVDIYLPDFKYSDPSLGARLSSCPNYPDVALEAIAEMVRQKGFLEICRNRDVSSPSLEIATKGVLVRHLILPGYVANSMNALTSLFLEFGRALPLSLMSQYYPAFPQDAHSMNRLVRKEEFDKVYRHATELGFEHLYVQFPESEAEKRLARPPFLPDFGQPEPFETERRG